MTQVTSGNLVFHRLLALLLTGIIAGLGAMLLALLLHAIQHLAFGYSMDEVVGTESFLQGVTDASAQRRFAVIVGAGLVAGCGWWLLARFGKPRVSISAVVKDPGKTMPFFTTLIHALLQIITVALGSPLGREVAPREVGALTAGVVARRLGLSLEDSRILLACGAGAGLAAVYNVPLAGAVFTLEVLLVSFRWESALAAMLTSAIAAWVATFGLGNESQYHFAAGEVTHSLVWWALIAGPILGAAAWVFRKLTTGVRRQVKTNWQMPVYSLLAFTLLAGLSLFFPQLPGNGKGPMQLALNGSLDLWLAAILLVLKLVVILAVLRGGAEGGLLTPGLTVGALLSILLFTAWQTVMPGGDGSSYALVGGASFLAASMQMPFTAVVLIMEFTHMDHDYFVPVMLCVCGSYFTCKALEINGTNG